MTRRRITTHFDFPIEAFEALSIIAYIPSVIVIVADILKTIVSSLLSHDDMVILCSVGLNGSRPGKVNGYTVAKLQSKLHLCLQAIEIEELVIAQRGFPKGDLYILFIACGAAGM